MVNGSQLPITKYEVRMTNDQGQITAAYLIEEALTLGSAQLDLGGLGLVAWPEGLHELTQLTQQNWLCKTRDEITSWYHPGFRRMLPCRRS